MRRTLVTWSATLALFGAASGPAIGQPVGGAAAAQASAVPSPAAQTSTGEAPPQPPAAVSPPIVVQGQRLRACKPRETACITAVADQLWARYPKEVETWCNKEAARLTAKRFSLEAMGVGDDAIDSEPPSAERYLCDHKPKAK